MHEETNRSYTDTVVSQTPEKEQRLQDSGPGCLASLRLLLPNPFPNDGNQIPYRCAASRMQSVVLEHDGGGYNFSSNLLVKTNKTVEQPNKY